MLWELNEEYTKKVNEIKYESSTGATEKLAKHVATCNRGKSKHGLKK